jgi:SAM-dependent methyltransferase
MVQDINMREGPENLIDLPPSRTLMSFWKSVSAGMAMAPASEDIETLAGTEYLQYEPLTPLSGVEEAVIRKTVVTTLKENNERLITKFAIASLVLTTCQGRDTPYLVDIDSRKWPDNAVPVASNTVLSPANRLRLFHDPNFWEKAQYHRDGGTMSATMQGYRPLHEYSTLSAYCDDLLPSSVRLQIEKLEKREEGLGGSMAYDLHKQIEALRRQNFPNAFAHIIDRIRKDCGKGNVRILDVGGGMGEAMCDAKKISPSVETYDLTLDEEPAMFTPDHLVLCPAERMPREWEEQMDLVLSNMAFQYFNYPDLALLNVVKALSVGGEAYLSFSAVRSPTEERELAIRLRSIYHYLQSLSEKGTVSIDAWKEGHIATNDWWRTTSKGELLYCGLKLKKLHSLQSVKTETEHYRERLIDLLT